MAKLAILGHATRGKEIIKLLEMLGGKNDNHCCGGFINRIYFINENGYIESCDKMDHLYYFQLSLEEFLEKFPYKVGDKVLAFGNKWTIVGAVWDRSIEEVVYTIKSEASGYTTTKLSNQLQPYKEEAIDKAIKAVFDANVQCCDIMNHLIKEETMEEELIPKIDFNKYCKDKYLLDLGNYEIKDENGKTYAVRKQPEYPKTYEECCKILGVPSNFELRNQTIQAWYIVRLSLFQQLLICRDAYWQIAGEQMGLGKPWEPDWENFDSMKYCIRTDKRIVGRCIRATNNKILSFPTEEMRDAFYENFKELIEECKELL